MTFIILRLIKLVTPLRMPDEELEVGDLAVHGEEAYPDEGMVPVGGSPRLDSSHHEIGPAMSTTEQELAR